MTTVVAGGLGVLLLAAALVLPSGDRSDVVPTGALVPVAAAGTAGGGDASEMTWSGSENTTTPGAKAKFGASSASVTGRDLKTATRHEATRAKRAAAAKAKTATARRAALRHADDVRAKRRRAHRAKHAGAAPSSSPATPAAVTSSAPSAPAPAAPAVPAPATPRTPIHRAPAPSHGSASAEFGGLN